MARRQAAAMAPRQIVAAYFWSKYHALLEDVKITSTPGYWEHLKPCAGWPVCREPIHQTYGNRGPVVHTLSYFDSTREIGTGRWLSRTRTWRALYEEETEAR